MYGVVDYAFSDLVEDSQADGLMSEGDLFFPEEFPENN